MGHHYVLFVLEGYTSEFNWPLIATLQGDPECQGIQVLQVQRAEQEGALNDGCLPITRISRIHGGYIDTYMLL